MARRIAPTVPLRWCTRNEASITARLVASGQSASQRSTDRSQASTGSTLAGQVAAWPISRSGMGMSAMAAPAAARLRSTDVALGGSRLLTRASVDDGHAGAVASLCFVQLDVFGGLSQFNA